MVVYPACKSYSMRYSDVILDADKWHHPTVLMNLHRICEDLETSHKLKVRRIILLRRTRPDRLAPGLYVQSTKEGLDLMKMVEFITVPRHCMVNAFVLGVLSERMRSGENIMNVLQGGSKTLMDLLTQTTNPILRMGIRKVLRDKEDDGEKDEAVMCVFGTESKPFSKSASVSVGYSDIYLFQDTVKYSIESDVEASASSRTSPDDYSDAQSVDP